MGKIIDDDSREYYFKAGKIAGKAIQYAAKRIKIGMPVRELLDIAENNILDQGAQLAFPAQASINEYAAHSCPTDKDSQVFKEEDMIKIDFGAAYNGFIGDTAKTVYLGNDSEKKKLLLASKKALENASKFVKANVKVRDIGKEIDDTISSYGFNPIKNLSGHGLGKYEIHSAPSMPNYESNSEDVLEENEMIAIEPFATTGVGMVKNSGIATIFNLLDFKPTRNPFAREAYKFLRARKGMPFSFTFLKKRIGAAKARIALNEFRKLEILQEHPPLRETSDGVVSQHEHSFLVGKNKSILSTKVDDD
jgi:methionyl aminopeptidase